MSTAIVTTRSNTQPKRDAGERRAELFQELREAASTSSRHQELDSLIRVMCRELLPTLANSRREEIRTFEAPLRYVSSCLTKTGHTDASGNIDRNYLIGRIESLLDLCAIAMDLLVATSVIERVKKNTHAVQLLNIVSDGEDRRRSDIANYLNISSEQAFSNLLKWLEDAEIIRRRTLGREKMIGLGAKGEAVRVRLQAERLVSRKEIFYQSKANEEPSQFNWIDPEHASYQFPPVDRVLKVSVRPHALEPQGPPKMIHDQPPRDNPSFAPLDPDLAFAV